MYAFNALFTLLSVMFLHGLDSRLDGGVEWISQIMEQVILARLFPPRWVHGA